MTANPARRLALLARTTSQLRPAQIAHRVRLRSQRAALSVRPTYFANRWTRPTGAAVGWPEGFAPLDRVLVGGCPSPEANLRGRFRFLGAEMDLGEPADWNPTGADRLWGYNLHYWEWAWSLLGLPDRDAAREGFAELFASWSAGTAYGRWDAWSPYVVALRTWVLCDLYTPLVAGEDWEDEYVRALSAHAGYLAANLEHDVGGNHLLKNLKALVGAGVFLDDAELVDLGRRHLERQLAVQVLADGGHFELSPSYHAQVLGDLVDVAGLMRAAGSGLPKGLDPAVTAMREWLSTMVMPDGDVALLNDAWRLGTERLAALGVHGPLVSDGLGLLAASGYVVAARGRMHLVTDVAAPCPRELPAHAQADCLTFELCLDGRRVVMDPGTSTYAGPRRLWERGTPAHNTVTVDGQDQTEVWGSFRAARRARPTLEVVYDDHESTTIRGSHDGYRRLGSPVTHRRTWILKSECLEVVDEIEGHGTHEVCWSVNLAEPAGVQVEVVDGLPGDLRREPAEVAVGFGGLVPATRVVRAVAGPLPIRIRHRIVPMPGAD